MIQHGIVETVLALTRFLAARAPTRSAAVDAAIGDLCDSVAEASSHALAAIRELDEMLELAFTRKERGPVDEALGALRRQLGEGEARQTALIEAIAADEATLGAVDTLLLYRVADGIGDIIQRCHEIGEQLELLLAR